MPGPDWTPLGVEESALRHKFRVGESVYFTASNVSRPAASGIYEIIRLLPTDLSYSNQIGHSSDDSRGFAAGGFLLGAGLL